MSDLEGKGRETLLDQLGGLYNYAGAHNRQCAWKFENAKIRNSFAQNSYQYASAVSPSTHQHFSPTFTHSPNTLCSSLRCPTLQTKCNPSLTERTLPSDTLRSLILIIQISMSKYLTISILHS